MTLNKKSPMVGRVNSTPRKRKRKMLDKLSSNDSSKLNRRDFLKTMGKVAGVSAVALSSFALGGITNYLADGRKEDSGIKIDLDSIVKEQERILSDETAMLEIAKENILPKIITEDVSYLRMFTGSTKKANEIKKWLEKKRYNVLIEKENGKSVVRVRTFTNPASRILKKSIHPRFDDSYSEIRAEPISVYSREQLEDLLAIECHKKNIPVEQGISLAYIESGLNPYAVATGLTPIKTKRGVRFVKDYSRGITAAGLMQINIRYHPETEDGRKFTWDLALEDVDANAKKGLSIFSGLLEKYQEPKLAAAVYNGGSGAITRKGNIVFLESLKQAEDFEEMTKKLKKMASEKTPKNLYFKYRYKNQA